MKYLKYFPIFEAEEGTDDIKSLPEDQQLDDQTRSVNKQAIEDSQRILKEFQEKRSKIESIFKDPKISDDTLLDSTLTSQIIIQKKKLDLEINGLLNLNLFLEWKEEKMHFKTL